PLLGDEHLHPAGIRCARRYVELHAFPLLFVVIGRAHTPPLRDWPVSTMVRAFSENSRALSSPSLSRSTLEGGISMPRCTAGRARMLSRQRFRWGRPSSSTPDQR